jgi:DNA primase
MTRKQVDRAMTNLRLPPPVPQRLRNKRAVSEGWSLLPEYILGAYDTIPQDLVNQGFSEETLSSHDVGVDRKNSRITFAIRDMLGRLVGISGRAMNDWQIPRYKVYDARPPNPASGQRAGELYGVVDRYIPDNRKHLYGFHSVYPERFFRPSEEQPPLIITEGYKSTLWLRQLGFLHAVGLQGSSLTEVQLRQLGRLRGPYFIMLDHEPGKGFPDRNGHCAAVSIARQLKTSGRVLICLYEEKPTGTAPDDLREPQEINHMIQNSKTIGQIKATLK